MDLTKTNTSFSDSFLKIKTIEMHTGGEPLRIPILGIPEIPGSSILEKRNYFMNHLDHIRKALIFEPRGHADMYAAIVTEAMSEETDFGTFFLHNEGYSTMCGHAIIALSKFAIETGLIIPKTEDFSLSIDAPPGIVYSKPTIENGIVKSTSFLNVASFVLYKNENIEVDGIGNVPFDIAYGGAFYAIIDANKINLSLDQSAIHQLIDWGKAIKKAIMQKLKIEHPFEDDLGFLYGTIFTGEADQHAHHSKNVCVFADGEVDRSATGSGVSARAALHYSRGELNVGKSIVIESILGTTMNVEVERECTYGPHIAIIPKVSGSANFNGSYECWVDPNDPLKDGFILR